MINEDQYFKQIEAEYYCSLEPQPEPDLDDYDEDLEPFSYEQEN